MAEGLDEPSPRPHGLSEAVGARELRKARARRTKDRTLWLGIGMFGVVGWSVAVPTLIGVVLGMWFDRLWPGHFSWTLAMLLGGVALGCLSAWYWVSRERDVIEGKVSAQAARQDYGIVMSGNAIDSAATEALRETMRAARDTSSTMIERGPGYDVMLSGQAQPRMKAGV